MSNTKQIPANVKQEVDELAKLMQHMTETERAALCGFAQGVKVGGKL